MTRRTRNPDPGSPWLVGVAEIAAYAQFGERTINEALLSETLEGRRATSRSMWRSKKVWVDAWIDGLGTGRAAS